MSFKLKLQRFRNKGYKILNESEDSLKTQQQPYSQPQSSSLVGNDILKKVNEDEDSRSGNSHNQYQPEIESKNPEREEAQESESFLEVEDRPPFHPPPPVTNSESVSEAEAGSRCKGSCILNVQATTESSAGTSSTAQPAPKKARRARHYVFDDEWLRDKEYESWLARANDTSNARCVICERVFSIKNKGKVDLHQHAKGSTHKLKVQAGKITTSLKSFYYSTSSLGHVSNQKVAAAEITKVYHTIRHAHSYLSADCESKIDPIVYNDSKIAADVKLGRTKQEAIAKNVLYPLAIQKVVELLKNGHPFALCTDASNKGNMKMFPVCVRFFDAESGINECLLDFFEEPDEHAKTVSERLTEAVAKQNLDIANVVAYGADNTNANYGKKESVYVRLKSAQAKLVKGNCNCHVLHNTAKYALKKLSYDVETLVLKVYSEFSHSAKNVANLKSFFDFIDSEYKEILRHVPTRWVSLFTALERLILNWEALKSYFISQGENEVDTAIWNFIEDQVDGLSETLTIPECYIYFVQHFLNLFVKAIKLLERTDTTAVQLYDLMYKLRDDLQNRREQKFCGFSVNQQANSRMQRKRNS